LTGRRPQSGQLYPRGVYNKWVFAKLINKYLKSSLIL
jgi:hypothetical protein